MAVGRAIVREPALFLMDEPLSNLDAQVRANTRAELKELQRNLGVTTLYVTHDQTEAMTLADRLAVMNHGRFEQIGPPLDVYREPATLFVAKFLSNPRLNLLEGCLEARGDRVSIRTRVALFPFAVVAGSTQPVTLGIRPEWLRLSDNPVADSTPLDVALVEPLGAEILVHARHDGMDLVSRMPADAMPSEQRLVWIDSAASRVDLFDPDGRRIPIARRSTALGSETLPA